MTEYFSNFFLALVFLLLPFMGCSEDFADNPKGNQPPKTFISIFTQNDLNTITSVRTINWWGDDPDGRIEGFIYTFDPNAPSVQTWSNEAPDPNWTFTEATEETFVLTLSGADTLYTIWVKAIDDEGAADPEGAIQRFSIANSRPTVEFILNTDVPETTFTVASFLWNASDLEGNETILKFQYALDDTLDASSWVDLDPNRSNVTLTEAEGLTEGEHVFFLRVIDVAGAMSGIIRMPLEENDIWYVREPKSSFLVIDDYNVTDNTATFFQSTLESIVGPVDIWDIKRNSSELEPTTSEAFTETLLLFDRILWYADTGPNLDKASVSVPAFLEQGGKIIMTTSFPEFASNEGDPVIFTPADSLGSRIKRLLRNQLLLPSGSFATLGFPALQISTAIIPNVFPLLPKVSSEVMYVLPEAPSQWPGMPAMGVIDRDATFVLFSLPLANLNSSATVPQLLEKILTEIF